MALSAAFTVNGVANPAAHEVAYSSTVTLALTSVTGATSIVWTIMACSDPDTAIPTLTLSGSPQGQTASFTMPADSADGFGRAFLVRCQVSNQVRGADGALEGDVSYGVVGAVNVAGYVPIVPGEENYRHATHGWAREFNLLLAGVGGGGGGTGDVIGPASSVDNRLALFSGTSGKIIKVGSPLVSDLILKSGSVAFTADQSMGGFKLTNVATPTTSTDAATKGYVDSAVASAVDWKASVRVATTANITLSGTQTIDGIAVIAGDRVLVKNQTTASQNGIYVVAAGAWSRATDADGSGEVTSGMACAVEEGSANSGRIWILTTANPITIGTTSLSFSAITTVAADGTTITNSGGTFSITTNGVGNSQFRQSAGLSLVGRSTNTTGNVADIAGTDGQIPRVSGTTLAFGSIDLSLSATVGTSKLAFANHADLTGLSVLGRAGTTSGVMAAITGTANTVLMVNSGGTSLVFSTLATSNYTDGSVTLAKLANGTGLSVIGRAVNSAGVNADIVAANDSEVLRRSGTSIGFGTLGTGSYTNASVTYAKIQNGTGLSVVGRSANTAGVNADIVGTDGQAFRVSGTTLGFGTLATAAYTDASVTYAKIQNGTGLSVVGRGGNVAGPNADIVGTDGQVLRVSGTTLGFGTVATAGIGDNQVTLAKLATQAGTSVLANATGVSAVPTALTATADGQFLQRVSGALVWAAFSSGSISGGTVVGQVFVNGSGNVPTWSTVDLANTSAVSGLLAYSNMANLSSFSVLGRSANTSGVMAAIQATADGHVLRRVGSTSIAFGTLATASYADASVTLAKLANGTACSVLGRSANSGGVYADIAIGTNDHVLMRTSNVVTSGFIADANVATAAAIAGTKISPNFGSQNVVTTGSGTFAGLSLTSAAVTYTTGTTAPTISQADTSGTTGETMTIWAQSTTATGGTAGSLSVRAGYATGTGTRTGGTLYLLGGSAPVNSGGTGGDVYIQSGAGLAGTGKVSIQAGSAIGLLDWGVTTAGILTIGNNSTGVQLYSGGATIPGFYFHLNGNGQQVDLTQGLLNFDSASTGVANDFNISYRGNSCIKLNTLKIGFYGATAVSKPTVTGSRGGNAALASLLTALATQGLITDSST